MRTLYDITNYINASKSKAKKEFYTSCFFVLEKYDEVYIRTTLSHIKKKILVYVKRRKTDKTIYKQELKDLRRYLRGLKFILNEKKRPRKASRVTAAFIRSSGIRPSES